MLQELDQKCPHIPGSNWNLKMLALGHVAPLVMSHMNGLLPSESKIQQTTETTPLTLKQ